MQLTYLYNDEPITLQAEPEGDGWRVRLPDGSEHGITARRLPGGVLQIDQPSRSFRVSVARTERGLELAQEGAAYVFTTADPGEDSGKTREKRKASGSLTAPMPGVVVDLLVTAGQSVEAYQPLAVVEAMKVMATLEAPFAGTVVQIHVTKGQQVKHGEPVVEVAPSTVDIVPQPSETGA